MQKRKLNLKSSKKAWNILYSCNFQLFFVSVCVLREKFFKFINVVSIANCCKSYSLQKWNFCVKLNFVVFLEFFLSFYVKRLKVFALKDAFNRFNGDLNAVKSLQAKHIDRAPINFPKKSIFSENFHFVIGAPAIILIE